MRKKIVSARGKEGNHRMEQIKTNILARKRLMESVLNEL